LGGFNTNQILFYAHNTEIAKAAAASVGLKIPASKLASHVQTIRPTAKSGVLGEIELRTSARSPATSAAFTNAFVAKLGDYMSNILAQRQQLQIAAAQERVKALQARLAAVGFSRGAAGLSNQLTVALAQEQELASQKPTTGYEVLQPALASSAVKSGGHSSLTSNKGILTLAGFLLGVLLAAGALLLIEVFDKRLRTSSRAADAFGFPVVAEIPAPKKGSAYDGFIDASASSLSPAAEAYRMLCTSVLLEGVTTDGPMATPYNRKMATTTSGTGRGSGSASGHTNGNGYVKGNRHGYGYANGSGHSNVNRSRPTNGYPNGLGGGAVSASELLAGNQPFVVETRQVVLVVSAGDEPTRPMVIANIAATYAGSGQRVLVASTQDLHAPVRGAQGRRSSGEITPMDIEEQLRPSRFSNVLTLPLDQFVDNRVQLITRAPAIFDAARQIADLVIVEAPSILAFHDAEAVAPCVDVVLVVGDCYSTTSEAASRTGDLLRRIGAPVLGVVLTNVHLRTRDIRRSTAPQAKVQSRAYLQPSAVTSQLEDLTVVPGGPTS
jgi:Mrp family chromosome partitioning ATPase/capsular polysaccharide biosynthesis protein